MKSAHPITNEAGAPGTGARIVQPGTLPQRKDTVAADLLSRLLSGNAMTGMDGVSSCQKLLSPNNQLISF